MGLTDRIASFIGLPARDQWPAISFNEYAQLVSFNGNQYLTSGLNQTLQGTIEETDGSFSGLVQQAYKTNAVVFACELARIQLFSEARFQYQQMRNGRPGELFGDPSLEVLEHPWPSAITGDLLTRALIDADFGGTAFNARRGRNSIRRLRPDWVTMVLGSESDPNIEAGDIDADVLGVVYHPGGRNSGRKPEFLLRDDVSIFAPIPDPLASFRGMPWVLPVLREIFADKQMTEHKSAYLLNGATPNLTVAIDKDLKEAASPKAFLEWIEAFKKVNPSGNQWDKFKTWYLAGGTVVSKVGSNMQEVDFKQVQGAGETRIAAAAGVPPVIVGLSEGLQAATYSNYGQARRRFADNTMRPLWRNMAGSLEAIVPPPSGARLWYDDRDIQALAEDKKDLAEVRQLEASQIRTLLDAGWTPESVQEAVITGDWGRLKHSGLYSVQLQPPMPDGPPKPETPPVAAIPKRDEALFGLLARSMDRPQPENHVHLDAGAFTTNIAPPAVTFEEGAIRGGDTHIATPDVNVTIEPAVVTIEDGAVQVTTPEVHVDPTPIEVTVENSVEPTPVEVRNEVHVDPTPVTVDVQVDPTPVSITNEIPAQPRSSKTIERDKAGQIVRIVEEPDGN